MEDSEMYNECAGEGGPAEADLHEMVKGTKTENGGQSGVVGAEKKKCKWCSQKNRCNKHRNYCSQCPVCSSLVEVEKNCRWCSKKNRCNKQRTKNYCSQCPACS